MYVPHDHITTVAKNAKRKALNEELVFMAARSNIEEGL